MSWILFRQGEWRRSLDVCREVLDDEAASPELRIAAHCVKGIIHAERGEFGSAEKHSQAAERLVNRRDDEFHRCYPIAIRARIAEGERRADEADALWQETLACCRDLSDWFSIVTMISSATLFWGARGNETKLSECSDVLSRIAGETGNPEAQANLGLILGEITLLHRDPEAAIRHFTLASERFQRMALPLEHLRARSRLGAALARQGKSREALQCLDDALRQARRLGMRLFAGQIAEDIAVLRNSGAAPASEGQAADLTPRQREILTLLAEGLANKEIAARLHISTRTVDMHMRHLFDRLSVRSRTEAVKKGLELGVAAEAARH
jgi:ATP/maltotriose-dependent transcriptional regulator MalT